MFPEFKPDITQITNTEPIKLAQDNLSNCKHRSNKKTACRIKTCCSSVTVERYSCTLKGIKCLTSEICNNCKECELHLA